LLIWESVGQRHAVSFMRVNPGLIP
jgi:hypothetical protein